MDVAFYAAERRVAGCKPAADEAMIYPLRVAAGNRDEASRSIGRRVYPVIARKDSCSCWRNRIEVGWYHEKHNTRPLGDGCFLFYSQCRKEDEWWHS
jgi:hypothetical protein